MDTKSVQKCKFSDLGYCNKEYVSRILPIWRIIFQSRRFVYLDEFAKFVSSSEEDEESSDDEKSFWATKNGARFTTGVFLLFSLSTTTFPDRASSRLIATLDEFDFCWLTAGLGWTLFVFDFGVDVGGLVFFAFTTDAGLETGATSALKKQFNNLALLCS